MYALQLASSGPASIIDISNNYGKESNKFVAFHCSNYAPSFFKEEAGRLAEHPMLDGFGACRGRIKSGPVTFLRISTDDQRGEIKAYVAEGELTGDEVETFGGYGVAKVEDLESLMNLIVEEGFEHHAAMVYGHIADVIEESIAKYMGWKVFRHP